MTWHNKVVRATAQARLSIASPEQVFAELKEYGAYKSRQGKFGGDNELEEALFARNDPLINLGLAQYASSHTIVTALYHSGSLETREHTYYKALRLACLANEIMQHQNYYSFYEFLSDEMQRLAHEGDLDEIEILMVNPSIGGILGDLYNRTGSFADVSDDRLLFLVKMSVGNPLINVIDDKDGYDSDFQNIHKGIFNLLRTVPLTIEWIEVLHSLLCDIEPADRTSWFYPRIPDLNEIIARWSDTKSDIPGTPADNIQGRHTMLTMVDEFRCFIAALFGEPLLRAQANGKDEDPDLVARCAWYGNALMSPERMQASWRRDGIIFVFSALQNSKMYGAACRPTLAEMIPSKWAQIFKERCEKWGDIPEEKAEMVAISRIEDKINHLTTMAVGGLRAATVCFATILAIVIFFKH
jgi:hypothetical protein